MQAIGFRRYGGPEALESLEASAPTLAPDAVLIQVAAAGVNPADWALRSGRLRFAVRLKLPFVPGSDVAGLVAAVGPGVTRFRPGDAVYAMLPTSAGGGYAPYAAVAEREAASAPPGLSFAEAAAVPLAGLTALQALRDHAGLAAGARVLINGASGGVGSFAVQIAKAMGARVTAASSRRNAELARGLGADEVIDYTSEDVTAAGAGYDVILDTASTHPFGRWRRALAPKGVVVTVAPTPANFVVARLTRLGGGRRLEMFLVRPSGADLELLSGWITSGRVRPLIDRYYPLADAIAAHRHSESRRARGKLVLLVEPELARESVGEGRGPGAAVERTDGAA
jgi:NADPH:quinone reductase-like Zn-dependent oxidoreductase